MRTALMLLGIVLLPVMTFAQLQILVVEYTDGGTALEGYPAEKNDLHGKRLGVLVIPDWMGVTEPYKRIADKLAEMGYVALVADIYGRGSVLRIIKKLQPKRQNIKQTGNYCMNGYCGIRRT